MLFYRKISTEFTVTDNGNVITVKLVIEKLGFEFELQSDIILS